MEQKEHTDDPVDGIRNGRKSEQGEEKSMSVPNVSSKTLPLVWLRLTGYVEETLQAGDKGAINALCGDINAFLNNLLNEDAFGTEGQLDPRGDHRS